MVEQYTCPECKGSGKITVHNSGAGLVARWHAKLDTCYFCEGTGFASDEDTFQEFWKK